MTYFEKLINQRKSLIVFGLAAIGLISAPSSASAFTIVNTPGFGDTAFEQLRTDGKFTELFVAEGRIGNNANNGTHEIDILEDTKKSFIPVAKGDRTWVNGGLVDFSLIYDGSKVTYKVDNQTLISQQFSGGVTDIFLRTNASLVGSKTSLKNLFFNGTSIGNLESSAVTARDTDYLQISQVTAPFTLTGKSSFSWTGARPSNSNLAFQIKVGNSPKAVPEPGMVSAIVGVGTIGYKRRKKHI
ncbi:MAG: PEP-CTERM sorting domain-containing protein [Calothrix sp. CSU_2_0]|nr:PEP-CTERM sorting domain-containing protein [Calothrix sp. CSU_2_0]